MLFSKFKKSKERRIAAFVDYEHWYIALENLHQQKPDIGSWFSDLTRRGRVVDAVFFADFSRDGLRDEIARIRSFSNKIIETRNPNPRHKKDYTDFIMLDNIYQRALSSENIDLYVILPLTLIFSPSTLHDRLENLLISFLCNNSFSLCLPYLPSFRP